MTEPLNFMLWDQARRAFPRDDQRQQRQARYQELTDQPSQPRPAERVGPLYEPKETTK